MGIEDEATAAMKLASRIAPMLHGHGPDVQGAVLADLLSTWISGFRPELREAVLEIHIKAVEEMVEKLFPAKDWGR